MVLACAKQEVTAESLPDEVIVEKEVTMEISVLVNGKALKAILFDNSSSVALYELLQQGDLTIEMQDYSNFEKVGQLPKTLPQNNESIETEAGDLILYQGNSFVIYYDRNRWSLTRLGKIIGIDQAGLKKILGQGNVTVTLSTQDYTIHSDLRP